MKMLEYSSVIISLLATFISIVVARYAVVRYVDVDEYVKRLRTHVDWFERVKMHEERLLKLQRYRFLLRALLFFVFIAGLIVFRAYPSRLVLLGIWCISVAVWVCDAYVTSSETFVYKDYVCYIYPHVNGNTLLKLTPTRGFFSCWLMSWNVTLYYLPFLLIIPLLLLSSNRVKEVIDCRPYDERVLEHLLIRKNEFIANQNDPFAHIRKQMLELNTCVRTNKVEISAEDSSGIYKKPASLQIKD